MFEVGDRVVYVNEICPAEDLKLNDKYIVLSIEYIYGNGHIIRLQDKGNSYYSARFELDKDYYRKLKLKKICSKLEIK